MQLTLPAVTIAALADSVNPCAISVLFLTLGFLVSLNSSRKRIITVSGLYVLGIFITYVLIGVGALSALSLFGIPRALSKIGSLILIITSLINLAEIYIPNFPIRLAIPSIIKPRLAVLMHSATLPSIFLLGVLVGLFEFPCTGGPYLMILTLLHDNSTISQGFLYLIYYNLIFISPLVAIVIAASQTSIMDKIYTARKHHSRKANLIAALSTLILGIVIFFL